MSVRVMNKGSSVEASGGGYVHGIPFISMIDSSPEICNGDRRFSVQETVVARPPEVKKKVKTCSSSSTSSIGKDSDVSSGKSVENSGDSDEVQSRYKGPLDAMEALEEVLPIRYIYLSISFLVGFFFLGTIFWTFFTFMDAFSYLTNIYYTRDFWQMILGKLEFLVCIVLHIKKVIKLGVFVILGRSRR